MPSPLALSIKSAGYDDAYSALMTLVEDNAELDMNAEILEPAAQAETSASS